MAKSVSKPRVKSARNKKSTKLDDFEYETWRALPDELEFPLFQRSGNKEEEEEAIFPARSPRPSRIEEKIAKPRGGSPHELSADEQKKMVVHTIADQIQLEKLKNANLSLELEISRNNVKLASLHTTSPATRHDSSQHGSAKFSQEAVPTDDPESILLPTLTELREKRDLKDKWLPNKFVLSTKGALEYKDMTLSEFVLGFLEMIKQLPTEENRAMLRYLSLLMEKATSYSWTSVSNFHLSMTKLIASGRVSWSDWDFIHSKATTAFSHADLSQSDSRGGLDNVTSPGFPSSGKLSNFNTSMKDYYCKKWNYEGSCSCSKTATNFKQIHKCKVCDSSDHPMLSCKKRRWPVPSLQSQDSNKQG